MESRGRLVMCLRRAQHGDSIAPEMFLRWAAPIQRRFLSRWLGGLLERQGILDDATQDAQLQVWTRYRSCAADTDAMVVAWLLAIARTSAVDALRRWKPEHRARISLCALSEYGTEAASPDDESVPFDLGPLFGHLTRHFGDEGLELLWRRLVRGESWEEVGCALGITWTAARRRFQRIISASRRYLMSYWTIDRGLDPSARRWLARMLTGKNDEASRPLRPRLGGGEESTAP